MNQVILNLMPAGSAKPAGTAAGAKGPSNGFFRALLAKRFLAAGTALKSRQAGPVAVANDSKTKNDSKPQSALEARIAKMIASGASQADVIALLASQLASSVAAKLDAPGADVRAKLQTVFAAALAPPGDSDGAVGSVAGQARILAQRFRRLESVAHAITGHQSGQQNRIAGNLLDARRAKEIPAPTTTNAAALSAFHPARLSPGIASTSMTVAPLPIVTPPAPIAAPTAAPAASAFAGLVAARAVPQTNGSGVGDGRTVKLGRTTPIASGGDTTLGRVLARAVLAADARQAPVASSGVPAVEPPTDAAVLAFVKSFEAALKTSSGADTPQVAQTETPGATTAAPAPVPTATDAPAAFVPPVAPFTIDRVGSIAAPAPAAVATPIDHSAIADQVLRGAFMRNVGQSSEMRLSLMPESLGDVSVKLVVNAGSVTAHVIADTAEVRDAIVAAQPQLSKSLADAGLKLTSFSVDLSGSGFAGFSQQQNDRSHTGGQANRSTSSATAEDGSDEALLEAIPSFGPSIAGKPSVGDYNYLA